MTCDFGLTDPSSAGHETCMAFQIWGHLNSKEPMERLSVEVREVQRNETSAGIKGWQGSEYAGPLVAQKPCLPAYKDTIQSHRWKWPEEQDFLKCKKLVHTQTWGQATTRERIAPDSLAASFYRVGWCSGQDLAEDPGCGLCGGLQEGGMAPRT